MELLHFRTVTLSQVVIVEDLTTHLGMRGVLLMNAMRPAVVPIIIAMGTHFGGKKQDKPIHE